MIKAMTNPSNDSYSFMDDELEYGEDSCTEDPCEKERYPRDSELK